MKVQMWAATEAVPNKIYFGAYGKTRRESFTGMAGYWIVYDNVRDSICYARAVKDDNGRPKGYVPYIDSKTGVVEGYIKEGQT